MNYLTRMRRRIFGPSEAELVCWEAYQVVGDLLYKAGLFDTDQADKILDNLAECRLVHDDVLPWPAVEGS